MSHFFAYLAKMKYIQRWGLMRNIQQENIQEHSLQVAMIAHALAIIRNRLYQGSVNPDKIAVIALYHEVGEIMIGDIPTPIKYFNQDINKEIDKIEEIAINRLYDMLPEEISNEYREFLFKEEADQLSYKIVKAADKISAYLKCIQEVDQGNKDFEKAKSTLEKKVKEIKLPEVQYFLDNFLESFTLSIDELN